MEAMVFFFMSYIVSRGSKVLSICYDTQIVVAYGAKSMVIWSGVKGYHVPGGRSVFSFTKHQGFAAHLF